MALLRTAVLVRCARAFVQSSGRRSYTPSAMTTVGVAELAERAKLAVLDPQRNAVKERLPAPQLGIFNDIPRQQFRESDARALALAGFSFVVNDAEHGGPDCVYGREENAMLVRLIATKGESGGLVGYFQAHRDGENLRILVDRILPDPSW